MAATLSRVAISNSEQYPAEDNQGQEEAHRYRYKLARSDTLLASDGMVVLEGVGPETTQFTEYDFFNANSGPLPRTLVWRQSLRGAFLSDLAIKLKAEKSSWSYERIATEGTRLVAAEAGRIEQCIAERKSVTLADAF